MEVESKRPRKSPSWQTLFRWGFFVVALAGFVWLLDKVGWGQIGEALASVGAGGALIIICLSLCENLGDAASLRASFRGRIKLLDVLVSNGAGALANDLAPMEAGEALKAMLVGSRLGASDGIAGTVVWNYVFKFVRPAAALVTSLVACIIGTQADPTAAWTVVGASVLAFLPFALFMLLLRHGAARLAVRLVNLVGLGRQTSEKWLESATQLDDRIRRFRSESPAQFRRVVFYQVLARTASFAMHVAIVRLVGLDYDLATCTLIYAGLSMAHYFVTLMPAKLGVGEGAGYLVFSAFGFDGGQGVIVYVVLRIRNLITNGIPGLIGIIRMAPRRKAT